MLERSARAALVVTAAVVLASGCGGSGEKHGTECDDPGDAEACSCPGQPDAGTMVCQEDGYWSDCDCSTPFVDGVGGTSGGDAGTGGVPGSSVGGSGGTATGGAGGLDVASGGAGIVDGSGGDPGGLGGESSGGTDSGLGGSGGAVTSGGSPGAGGVPATGGSGDTGGLPGLGGTGTAGDGTGGEGTGGDAAGDTGTGGDGTGGEGMGGDAAGGTGTGGDGSGGEGSGGEGTGGEGTGGEGTGGEGTGGASSGCPGADAAEFAQVSGWLDNSIAPGALPGYAYDNIDSVFGRGAAFDELACSIAMSCLQFAPSGWLRECEDVVTSAIVAESSYNPESVVEDSYGGAADPTVGLLQIRFSSTVQDYNYYGPLEKIEAIGCSWPSELPGQAQEETFWRNQGSNYLSFMQSVPCNVGLASWYYFYNATGNGGPTATWIHDYCAGNGTGGTMVVGLLSHLMGGGYERSNDGTHPYPWGIECCADGNPEYATCNGCTGRFAALMGIGTSASRPTPDPFQQTFSPEPEKYCR